MMSFPRFTRSSLATAGLLSVTAFALAADRHAKLSPDLSTATSSSVSVIIQYDTDPTGADEQRIAGRNGKVDRTLRSIRAIAAQVPQSSLDALSTDPNVSYVSPAR